MHKKREFIVRTWIIFFSKLRDCSGQAQKGLQTSMDKKFKKNFERERIVLKKLLFEFRAGSKGLG